MAAPKLKRKLRRDRAKARVRRQSLKNLNFKPVTKSIDIEKVKEEFKSKA